MTSREIVIKTLQFGRPERIAMDLPDPYPSDIFWGWLPPDPKCPGTPWRQLPDGTWEMVDEWGNTWRRLESISKGEVARGALENWEAMATHTWPDYASPERYAAAKKAFAEHSDKFRILGIPGFPFNIARKMRRIDQFLVDIICDEDKVVELLGRVEAIMADAIRMAGAVGADAVMFAEDWGAQKALLINPAMWRKLFRPGFDRLCGVARKSGLYVFMHSCGYIYEIIEDLIEAGINVLQLDQPRLMGIERLADKFAGRVTFWCPVDIQSTLQTRDAARIEADAKLMVERFGCNGRGGFIAGRYPSDEAIGLEPKWQRIASAAFAKYGGWKPQ